MGVYLRGRCRTRRGAGPSGDESPHVQRRERPRLHALAGDLRGQAVVHGDARASGEQGLRRPRAGPSPRVRHRPAIVVELKWDRDAETAIAQIHERRYLDALAPWAADGGTVILAGVTYDKKTRAHSCAIERVG